MSRRVIISIDGGGIRGVIALIVLKEIQKRLDFNLFSLDTSWWGTSTGALIAGGLKVQRDFPFSDAVQRLLEIYEFRSSLAIRPQGVSLPTRALNQLILSNFGDTRLEAFPNLHIVASKADDLTPVVFNALNSCKISDAIRASCAFPEIFPPVEINGKLYVDGFFNAKNPSALALEHELKSHENLTVISLGTGKLRTHDAVEESVFEVHRNLEKLAESDRINYHRINPVLIEAVDSMQNTSPKNILNLRHDTLRYLEENTWILTNIVNELNALNLKA